MFNFIKKGVGGIESRNSGSSSGGGGNGGAGSNDKQAEKDKEKRKKDKKTSRRDVPNISSSMSSDELLRLDEVSRGVYDCVG